MGKKWFSVTVSCFFGRFPFVVLVLFLSCLISCSLRFSRHGVVICAFRFLFVFNGLGGRNKHDKNMSTNFITKRLAVPFAQTATSPASSTISEISSYFSLSFLSSPTSPPFHRIPRL